MKRPWTLREKEILRREYRLRPLAELALLLGRTCRAVSVQAIRLGVARTVPPIDLAAVRRLHAAGESDQTIALQLGVPAGRVWRARQRLGLSAHYKVGQHSPAGQSRLASVRRQIARVWGGWSGYLLSRMRLRHQGAVPGCVGPAQVEICRLLASRGPLTMRQLAELRGRPECSTRGVLGKLVDRQMVRKLSGSHGAARYEVCVPVSME